MHELETPAQPHVEEDVGVSTGGSNCLNAPMTNESKSQNVTAGKKIYPDINDDVIRPNWNVFNANETNLP